MANSLTRWSILIRFGLWLLVIAAVCCAAWLVLEWYNYAQTMPDKGWNFRVIRIVGLLLVNLVFAAVLVTIGILYLWVRMASALPDLQGWHIQQPDSEFCASDALPGYTFDNYLKQENQVFEELERLAAGPWATQAPGVFCRYRNDSVCNPASIADRNWNRSHILIAPRPVGGVLLIHGLSDSPYSLRALGQRLHGEGYTVIWLRVPGHGTSPGALANVSSDDWTSAVRIAMLGLRSKVPAGCPLFLGGYSNGGALSVHYALSSLNDQSLPNVKAIMLFSPMIGINPMAKLTRLYHVVGIVSRNRKSQWSNIDAEIDPFKYSSWPMNASVQAWSVTQSVEQQIAKLQKSGRMNEMPPVLAMQSVVDSTVVVPKLITVLFDRLTSESSELFLFDINRVHWFENLFNLSFERQVLPKLARTDLPFRLSVLKNAENGSDRVVVQTRDGQSWVVQETEMTWPRETVSLSHIAVPIPPDDSIYGTAEATSRSGLPLGSLSLRAEPSALLISNSLFVRCRHNPFYQFMEDRVINWLSQFCNQQQL